MVNKRIPRRRGVAAALPQRCKARWHWTLEPRGILWNDSFGTSVLNESKKSHQSRKVHHCMDSRMEDMEIHHHRNAIFTITGGFPTPHIDEILIALGLKSGISRLTPGTCELWRPASHVVEVPLMRGVGLVLSWKLSPLPVSCVTAWGKFLCQYFFRHKRHVIHGSCRLLGQGTTIGCGRLWPMASALNWFTSGAVELSWKWWTKWRTTMRICTSAVIPPGNWWIGRQLGTWLGRTPGPGRRFSMIAETWFMMIFLVV